LVIAKGGPKISILFGCIADDFTGASDAASFLMAGGLNTLLFNGIPSSRGVFLPQDVDAVVIALKTRTDIINRAVDESVKAAEWLMGHGAKQLYIKYCSTFDSSPTGNIGPICDAVLKVVEGTYSVLCPSLPVNKRTVKDGILYVDGIPLAQSHMRDHPLTPMWDSFIPNLMKDQSKYPCFILNRDTLIQGKHVVEEKIKTYLKTQEHFYLVPDYVDDNDAQMIVKMFGHLPLLTGGSGILQETGRILSKNSSHARVIPGVSGKAIILAGSCSPITRKQVKHYKTCGGRSFMIESTSFLSPERAKETIWADISKTDCDDILVYAPGSEGQKESTGMVMVNDAIIIEQIIAGIAEKAVYNGYRRIIVAGGETSGAVTRALQFNAYYIGRSVAPGVPVMQPLDAPDIRLVLKSGNFGQEDFFVRALQETGV
jgi:uncharacterized protein YgbK (DUF1537 family)